MGFLEVWLTAAQVQMQMWLLIWSCALQSERLTECWRAILNTVIHSYGAWQCCSTIHTSSSSTTHWLACSIVGTGGAFATSLRSPRQLCWRQEWQPLNPCHRSRPTASTCIHCELFHSSHLQCLAHLISHYTCKNIFLPTCRWQCFIRLDSPFISTENNSLIFCHSANRQGLIKSTLLSFSTLKGTKIWYPMKSKKPK